MTKTNNTIQTLTYIIGWFLLWIAGLAVPQNTHAFAKDPVFEARTKRGVAQFKQLIRQNRQNNLRNQRYKNWYIFGDYVRMMGNNTLINTQYGVLTPKQIEEINKDLIKFNEKNGVIFYVYLTGFKVPLDSKVSSYEIKDYGKFNGDYKAMFQALDQQRKKIALQEVQTYEAKLLQAIFSQGSKESQAPKKTAIYGQTIFIAPELDQNNQVKYKIQNFVGFAFGDDVKDSYANDFKNLHGRWRHQPKKVAESSVAYYLRVHTKAAIDAFEGKKMPEGDNDLEKYSAAWFAKNTAANRNSEQWTKDIMDIAQLLKAQIRKNTSLSFEARTDNEHNFARRYVIGKYHNEETEGGPILSPEAYTILNDKMVLLEQKTTVKYYVVYYEVDYYIPTNDPDFGRSRDAFMKEVMAQVESSLGNKTVVLCIPFFRAMTAKVNDNKSPYILKSFAFPRYHKGEQVTGKIEEAFSAFKSGDAYNLALALYKEIPKPHYVYAQYFRLDGKTVYSILEKPEKVVGFTSIYEFRLLIDERLNEMKRFKGSIYWTTILKINASKPNFKPYPHNLRESFIRQYHKAFAMNHVAQYQRVFDFLKGANLPPNVPLRAFIKKQKEPDLVENVLDVSSLLLGLVGFDAIPETIGLVYAHIKDDDQAKLKYLIGLGTSSVGGVLLKKISGKDIAIFLTRNPQVWVRFVADKSSSVVLKKVQISKLQDIVWNQSDEALDLIIHAEGNVYKALLENKTKGVTEVLLNEKSLAKLIESVAKSPDQPVRLLSCSDLQSAHKLSKHLDRPVIATDGVVHLHGDGGITTVGSQQWYKLEAGNKVEVSAPRQPDARYKDDFVRMGKKIKAVDEQMFTSALTNRGVLQADAEDIFLRLTFTQDKLGNVSEPLINRLFKIIPNARFQNPQDLLTEIKKCVDGNGNIISQEAFEKFSKEVDGALEILNKNSNSIAWIPKRAPRRFPGAKYSVYNMGVAKQGTILYHYTDLNGYNGILSSKVLHPSLTTKVPNHAHFGDGYYMSNYPINTKKLTDLSKAFVENPTEGLRFEYCVAIDVSGLTIYRGVGKRHEVFMIAGNTNLNLNNRIVSNLCGKNTKK